MSCEGKERKNLRPKIWSQGTNLGYPRARLAKPLPQIFSRVTFWVVLRVLRDPVVAVFMEDFFSSQGQFGPPVMYYIHPAA